MVGRDATTLTMRHDMTLKNLPSTRNWLSVDFRPAGSPLMRAESCACTADGC